MKFASSRSELAQRVHEGVTVVTWDESHEGVEAIDLPEFSVTGSEVSGLLIPVTNVRMSGRISAGIGTGRPRAGAGSRALVRGPGWHALGTGRSKGLRV